MQVKNPPLLLPSSFQITVQQKRYLIRCLKVANASSSYTIFNSSNSSQKLCARQRNSKYILINKINKYLNILKCFFSSYHLLLLMNIKHSKLELFFQFKKSFLNQKYNEITQLYSLKPHTWNKILVLISYSEIPLKDEKPKKYSHYKNLKIEWNVNNT